MTNNKMQLLLLDNGFERLVNRDAFTTWAKRVSGLGCFYFRETSNRSTWEATLQRGLAAPEEHLTEGTLAECVRYAERVR